MKQKKEGSTKKKEPRKEVKDKKKKEDKKTRSKKKNKIKKKKQDKKKPNQAGPLQVKEDTNKIITTGEGQNDHNKNQYCQSKYN